MSQHNHTFRLIKPPELGLVNHLIPILIQANQILREEYQDYCKGNAFFIEQKGDESPVTQADLKVNQFLVQSLEHIFPEIPILSEESDYSQRHLWQRCWLIDPLDGTREFIYKRDKFTINLSLIVDAQTIIACIAVPYENVIYLTAETGMPYKLDINSNTWYQYIAYQHSANAPLKIATSHRSHSPKYQHFIEYLATQQSIECVQAGSAYKFCMMLEGLIDLYPRFHPTSEWDTSAGQLLLERIGGGLLSLKQEPFLYNTRKTLLNNGFIAVTHTELFPLAFTALQHSE